MSTGQDYPRIAPYSRVEIAAHAAVALPNVAAVLWSGGWLVRHHAPLASAWLWLPLATLAGMTLADFVSGFLHWLFDTWFSEERPQLRRMVIMVREHHIRPLAIFQYSWYHDAAPLSVIALGVCAALLWPALLDRAPSVADYCRVWTGLVANLSIVFMLELHKLGHARPAPGWLGRLQRWHLVMSPRHHGKHHRGRHDADYCIVNGLADHALNAIHFWRAIEAVISRATGAVPRSNDRVWLANYRNPAQRRSPSSGAEADSPSH